jgi:hypothetical protein
MPPLHQAVKARDLDAIARLLDEGADIESLSSSGFVSADFLGGYHASCILHLASCILHLASCILHLAPCTLHLVLQLRACPSRSTKSQIQYHTMHEGRADSIPARCKRRRYRNHGRIAATRGRHKRGEFICRNRGGCHLIRRAGQYSIIQADHECHSFLFLRASFNQWSIA